MAKRLFDELEADTSVPHVRYGRGLQAEIETTLRAKFAAHQAELDAAAEQQEAERAEREADARWLRHRQQWWQQAGEDARDKAGISPFDWARMDQGEGSKRQRLTQAVFDEMPEVQELRRRIVKKETNQ